MTQTRPDVSVIICTYTVERWQDLLAAVHSVQQQEFPSFEIVVVVDHNPKLLEKARAAIHGAILVENNEPKGLSGARNAGVAASKGRLIAFLDDDATARPDWLSVVSKWCNQPGILGAGCKIVPLWLAPRPAWFPEEFGWVLGFSYLGLPKTAAMVRNLIGSNMCFRREVFEEIGGFRTEIGRINKIPLGCEETELCIRASQRWPESRFIYEPGTSIHHTAPPSRTNWAYFRARCYAEGLSKALMTTFVGAKDGLQTERSYIFRTLPRGVLRGISDALYYREWSDLARAFAILAGLGFTIAGFLVGSAIHQFDRIRNSLTHRSIIHTEQ